MGDYKEIVSSSMHKTCTCPSQTKPNKITITFKIIVQNYSVTFASKLRLLTFLIHTNLDSLPQKDITLIIYARDYWTIHNVLLSAH